VLNTSALESGITECGLEVSRSKLLFWKSCVRRNHGLLETVIYLVKVLNFHLLSLMIKSIVCVLILILGRGSPNLMLIPNCYL